LTGLSLAAYAPAPKTAAFEAGYSHYNFITPPEVPQIIGKFLADPLTNAPAGAAAASQAAPPTEKKQ
jgi:hypothetical protein